MQIRERGWKFGTAKPESRISSFRVESKQALLPRLLRRNPPIDLRLQHRQRQRAAHQHLGVEVADVEFRPELPLRLRAQLADLELPDLVGERLAGNGDVALGLGGGVAAPA